MQIKKSLAVWVVIVSLILTVGIAALILTARIPTNPLNDTYWVLTTLNGQLALPGMVSPFVTLNFEDNRLNGSDGCNDYSGPYWMYGSIFIVNGVGHTLLGCLPVSPQPEAYTTALTQTVAYKVEGQQLTLFDASGKARATFRLQSSDLGGTAWIVTRYYNSAHQNESFAGGSKLTANFSADGKLSGSSGCNDYTTRYETSGKSITIGPATSTSKICAEPTGVMEEETQFLKALATGIIYRRDGNEMELRSANGQIAVTFRPRPAQSP